MGEEPLYSTVRLPSSGDSLHPKPLTLYITPYTRNPILEVLIRKVDIRLSGNRNSNFHDARPVHLDHLDDEVESNNQVVNKELSL